MLIFILAFLSPLLQGRAVEAYSRGAPQEQCTYMTPKHSYQPQATPPFAKIRLFDYDHHRAEQRRSSRKTGAGFPKGVIGACLGSGEKVGVALEAEYGQFKGFLLRAEDANAQDMKALGTFWLNDTSFGSPSQYLHCQGSYQNAVTHSAWVFSRGAAIAHWEPPRNFTGWVQFRATVVVDFKTYWTNILSPRIRVLGNDEMGEGSIASSADDEQNELERRRPRQKETSRGGKGVERAKDNKKKKKKTGQLNTADFGEEEQELDRQQREVIKLGGVLSAPGGPGGNSAAASYYALPCHLLLLLPITLRRIF